MKKAHERTHEADLRELQNGYKTGTENEFYDEEDIKMSEDKRLLTDDEMAKVTGGVVMEFPDGWYVCTDGKERRQVLGPYESEDRAWRVAAENGYCWLTESGPLFSPAKED